MPTISLFRASLDKKGRDPEFFLKAIRQLGKLFDFDASEPYDYAGFGEIFEEVDQSFNISAKIREVSVCLKASDLHGKKVCFVNFIPNYSVSNFAARSTMPRNRDPLPLERQILKLF